MLRFLVLSMMVICSCTPHQLSRPKQKAQPVAKTKDAVDLQTLGEHKIRTSKFQQSASLSCSEAAKFETPRLKAAACNAIITSTECEENLQDCLDEASRRIRFAYLEHLNNREMIDDGAEEGQDEAVSADNNEAGELPKLCGAKELLGAAKAYCYSIRKYLDHRRDEN